MYFTLLHWAAVCPHRETDTKSVDVQPKSHIHSYALPHSSHHLLNRSVVYSKNSHSQKYNFSRHQEVAVISHRRVEFLIKESASIEISSTAGDRCWLTAFWGLKQPGPGSSLLQHPLQHNMHWATHKKNKARLGYAKRCACVGKHSFQQQQVREIILTAAFGRYSLKQAQQRPFRENRGEPDPRSKVLG